VLVRVGGITVVFGSYYRSEEDYAAFMRVLESVKFGSAITKNGAFALTPEAPQPAPTAAPAAVPAASAARIVFEAKSATGEDLFSINPDGSDLRQITHGPGLNQEPACAPDGTRLAFTSWRDNTHSLYTVNADGAGERLVSDGPGNLAMPAWSPDSVRLVFRSDAVSALYVLTPGGAQEKLPILDDHLYAPAWSPDGRRLAYEVFDGQKADIRIANLDGSDDINLTPGFGFAHQPAWSPDSRQIAFHGHPTGGNTSEIYVMAADEQGRFTPGAEIRCLTCDANTDSRGNKYRPAWSPDGKQIAFHRKDGDGFDIWLMNADGSNPTQLTDGLDASNPCWIR
jgi:dipeptidyl aminopeptidase/acylaminoacyl peptidase